ncbi:hypothetical protein DITRI_Ditri18aG0108900 [Diplodiscus trichospermus]
MRKVRLLVKDFCVWLKESSANRYRAGKQIKAGASCRGERLVKYNQTLERSIEVEIKIFVIAGASCRGVRLVKYNQTLKRSICDLETWERGKYSTNITRRTSIRRSFRGFFDRSKNQQMKVRMMLPMSIRCNTCGNYIYKETKFNSRKEDVIRETYLGIQIFRFYFKCTKCSAEIAIKTDSQNSDYVVEFGATRNFEPWRAEDEEAEKDRKRREFEDMGDAMKSLENRTLDSKREMDILAALDEVKSMNSRHEKVSVDAMLKALQRTAAEKKKKKPL